MRQREGRRGGWDVSVPQGGVNTHWSREKEDCGGGSKKIAGTEGLINPREFKGSKLRYILVST